MFSPCFRTWRHASDERTWEAASSGDGNDKVCRKVSLLITVVHKHAAGPNTILRGLFAPVCCVARPHVCV